MTETDLEKVYKFSTYPRETKISTNKRFVNMDNGSFGGTNWNCFYVKDNKLYYFDTFGVGPVKFLLQQILKPMTFHKHKIQNMNSKLCGTYSSYLFYSLERMHCYDAVLKTYFG